MAAYWASMSIIIILIRILPAVFLKILVLLYTKKVLLDDQLKKILYEIFYEYIYIKLISQLWKLIK